MKRTSINLSFTPSISPYSSPCLLVPAKRKSPHLVVDYCELNKVIVGDRYPLPNIKILLQSLGNAKVISVSDFHSSIYQVPVAKEDQYKTAISTPHGQYEFERSPMGVKTSPNIFQRLADIAFEGLIGTICGDFIR